MTDSASDDTAPLTYVSKTEQNLSTGALSTDNGATVDSNLMDEAAATLTATSTATLTATSTATSTATPPLSKTQQKKARKAIQRKEKWKEKKARKKEEKRKSREDKYDSNGGGGGKRRKFGNDSNSNSNSNSRREEGEAAKERRAAYAESVERQIKEAADGRFRVAIDLEWGRDASAVRRGGKNPSENPRNFMDWKEVRSLVTQIAHIYGTNKQGRRWVDESGGGGIQEKTTKTNLPPRMFTCSSVMFPPLSSPQILIPMILGPASTRSLASPTNGPVALQQIKIFVKQIICGTTIKTTR